MRERVTTLLLALAALALFYGFFLSRSLPQDEVVALPLSTQTGPDGYQALWRWLDGQDIHLVSLRNPYRWLTDARGVADEGNVLITTLPHRVPARSAELTALDAWISRGNTLLVMAALDDTPRWALDADPAFLSSLRRITRLDFAATPDAANDADTDADTRADTRAGTGTGAARIAPARPRRVLEALERLLTPQRIEIRAADETPAGNPHPLFAGVAGALAISDYPASRWRVAPLDAHAVLEVGAWGASPAVWVKRQGRGQLIVFAVASVFSNALIGEQDNARLFANIIAWSRGAGGSVLFDDVHQGAAAYYDSRAFFHDPRLHRTVLWILLLWLAFVLGSQRLRPATDAWNRADVTGFIAVTGGFLASTLPPAAAARQLFENFFNGVRRSSGMREDGAPIWDRLSADARVPASWLAELERLYARCAAGRTVDLVRIHNLLSLVKGTLE